MTHQPLAYYLRPTTLDGMVGQPQIRQTIRSFLEKGQIPSMIFRGAP
jgi:replication-associated recombination protein RarA